MAALALATGGAALLMASLAFLAAQGIGCRPDDCGLGNPRILVNVLMVVASAMALGWGLHTRLKHARDEPTE